MVGDSRRSEKREQGKEARLKRTVGGVQKTKGTSSKNRRAGGMDD